MIDSIKITSLNNIGSNLSYSTIFPVVDVSGTPITDKANLQIIGNYILSQAGGANMVQAAQATLAQSVVNAAQPNITSVGTLTSLVVSGNANITGNLNIPVSDLKIFGGTNGYVLQTDGTGNLTWTAQTGGGGGNGSPGGSNTQVQFNDSGAFGGNSGFTYDKTTSTLSVGNVALPGNAVLGAANGNILFNTPNNSTLTIRASDGVMLHNWIFESDGTLTFPTNRLFINGDVSIFGTNSAVIQSNNQTPLNLITSGANSALAMLWIEDYANINSSNVAGVYANPAPGARGVRLVTGNVGNFNNWNFENDGNLVLPSNSFAVKYANGTQVSLSGTYGNSNVATFLASYGSNTISTTGNVTVGNIIGNGQSLTSINGANVTGTVPHANVAEYANVQIANANVTGYNLVLVDWIAGNHRIEADLNNLKFNANTHTLSTTNIVANTSANIGNLKLSENVIAAIGLNLRGDVTESYAYLSLPSDANSATQPAHLGNDNGNVQISTINQAGPSSYIWTFDNGGNLTLPGNTFAINYANGTQVSLGGSYGNSDVATFLASYGSNTISTTGNVTVGNIIGNGAALTDINGSNVTGTVGNANLSQYLNITDVSDNYSYHIVLSAGSGDKSLHIDAGDNLQYNPDSGLLTAIRMDADNFVGNLNYSYGYPIANVVGIGNIANINLDGNSQTWLAGNGVFANIAIPTVGNIATINLDGSSSNVLYGNGVFAAAPSGGGGSNISNGNSNVNIATANGNVTIAAVGNSVVTITGTGANITGTANISGNANVGNLGVAAVVATANISTTGYFISGNQATGGFQLGNSNSRLKSGDSNSYMTMGQNPSIFPDTAASASAGLLIGGSGYILGNNGSRCITLNYGGGSGVVGLNSNVQVGASGSGTVLVPGTVTTGVNSILAGPTFTPLANTMAGFVSNVNSYTQLTIQNKNTGADATVDFVATADNGSDTVNYLDMGIINSGYDNNTPTNSLGNIVFAADSYIYAQGNTSNASQSGGNLAIGTTVPGKNVKIFAGGVNNSSIVANIGNTGVSVTGNITVSGNIIGTSPNVSLVAGSYTATFDNTGVLTLPTNGGDEGGELRLGIPQTNTTLANRVTIDVYQDRLRFFEGSANAKGAYIDLSQGANGAGTLLNNRVSTIAGANTAVTLQNIQARVGGSPTRLYVNTVSGSMTGAGTTQTMISGSIAVSSWINVPIGQGAGNAFAMSGAISTNGDTVVLNLVDQGAGSGMWRITGMIANTSANLYSVSIERLA